MGTITLEGFRDQLLFDLRNRSDAGVTDVDGVARTNRWINAAYRHMCLPNVHNFREMHDVYDITLVNGTNSYATDEATVGHKIVWVRSVYNIIDVPETATSRKRRLSPRNIRWLDRKTLTSGTPQVYVLEGNVIYISNVPGAAEAGQIVRVRTYREPAALALDADTTVIASFYDQPLQIGAKWVAEQSLGYRERAELTKQDYVALLNEGPESEQLEGENWDFQVDVNPNAQQDMYV